MDELVRHRQTKAPETDRSDLNHRATSRLYPLGRVEILGSVLHPVEQLGQLVRALSCEIGQTVFAMPER